MPANKAPTIPTPTDNGAPTSSVWLTQPGAVLTVADVIDFENATKLDFAQVTDALENSTTGGRLQIMAALLWVYRRKADPDFTYQAALELDPVQLAEGMTNIAAAIEPMPQEADPANPS